MAFRNVVEEEIGKGSKLVDFCRFVPALGPPTYVPEYMLKKGDDETIPKTVEGGMRPDFEPRPAFSARHGNSSPLPG